MSASDFQDSKLAEALAECERLREENRQLRGRLEMPIPEVAAPPAAAPTPAGTVTGKSSPEEKVKFFLSLFRGREDVYAVRWEGRNGKAGYSPACRRVWGKPFPKHSEEPQEYFPLTNRVIHDHLMGKLTAGVYPLLADETCWFLAADFDKTTWQEDVRAYLHTCSEWKVPALLERSRSGRGGHIWIFFAAPLPARLARKLGAAIGEPNHLALGILGPDFLPAFRHALSFGAPEYLGPSAGIRSLEPLSGKIRCPAQVFPADQQRLPSGRLRSRISRHVTDGLQRCTGLGSSRGSALVDGPCGPGRVYGMQRGTQYILVKEGDGVEGLALSAGDYVSFAGQFRPESFDLLVTGQGWRHAQQCPDLAPQPMNVGFLGGEGLVLSADDLSRPLNRLICRHNRLLISSLFPILAALQYTNQPSHHQSWASEQPRMPFTLPRKELPWRTTNLRN